MEKNIESGEWFISSEHEFNKFKHGAKSLLIFVILPIFILQLVLGYFIIPDHYSQEVQIIKDGFSIIFEDGLNTFFKQNELFKDMLLLILTVYFEFFILTSPFYILVGFIFYKLIKRKTNKLLDKNYVSGSKLTTKLDVLYSYFIEHKSNFIKELILSFKFSFMREKEKEKYLKNEIKDLYNFELAGIPILKEYEISHVMIPGASRKGKSQLLRNPIFKAKEMSREHKAKGIITDEKGEWFSKTGDLKNGDLVFNPADIRTLKWTIFNDIENIIDIENYAAWIIPLKAEEKDPFWINSAREILMNCLIYLWNENKKTNKDLKDLINSGQQNMYEVISSSLSVQAAEFLEKKDSYLSFKSYMKFINYLEDGDFSVAKWVNETDQGFIYLTSNVKTKTIFKPILTLFVNVFSAEVLTSKDNLDGERIYLFLEEFTALDKLEKVIDLLKLSGSKGVSIWLAFQDFQQITKIYGQNDMPSIINNCSTTACLGLNEPEAAEYFSKRFAEMEFKEFAKNHSMGIKDNRDGLSLNQQKKSERIVKASDLLNLPRLKAFIKIDGAPGIVKMDLEIKKDEPINEPYIYNDNLSTPLKTQETVNNIVPDMKSIAEEMGLDDYDLVMQEDIRELEDIEQEQELEQMQQIEEVKQVIRKKKNIKDELLRGL